MEVTVNQLIEKLQAIAKDNGGNLVVQASESFFGNAWTVDSVEDRGDGDTRHVILYNHERTLMDHPNF